MSFPAVTDRIHQRIGRSVTAFPGQRGQQSTETFINSISDDYQPGRTESVQRRSAQLPGKINSNEWN